MSIKKPTRGGKRANAGAKLKYGEKTAHISRRVPKSMKKYFDDFITDELTKIKLEK